jgi:Raf kinase inhibitor-like YbhB/YbcL family protein
MAREISVMLLVIMGCLFIHVRGVELKAETQGMRLRSSEFEHNQLIPKTFTCQGKDVNPTLIIEGVPQGAQTLALIVDDPDAPMGTWVHWVVFDIPVISKIGEDSIPGLQGINDFGKKNYGGPCPPSGIHRYFFKLYALDTALNLKEGISKQELERSMQGHILDHTELIGRYTKD